MWRVLAALFLTSATGAPIAAFSSTSLDGSSWVATPASGDAIAATVPGDLISDLYAAGRIANPWLDLTWREQAGQWDLQGWAYTRLFDAPPLPLPQGADTWLVLDSVKLAASIYLNGALLGSASNQHIRYTFPVGALLRAAGNNLTIAFPPTVSDARNDGGRYMGASGGWDWAAYSNETTGRTPKGIRTFSKGIAGSVSLVGVASAAITEVKPLVFYQGAYPLAPLTRASAGPWTVNVTVYLAPATAGVRGQVSVAGSWDPQHPATAAVALGAAGAEAAVTLTLAVPQGAVELWWTADARTPATPSALYTVSAAFAPSAGGALVAAPPRPLGFRALALVTDDDSAPSALANKTGSGALTMRLRLNGANVHARGANWIPLEGLEARNSGFAQATAVASAVAANMNALRVWGGGVWPSDDLLQACDSAGVLLYVDAMYASQADSHHFADPGDAAQAVELAQNVRRLAAHPSVALLDACNECGGSAPFDTFVAPAIAAEDPSRPIWPASPSAGWAGGVDRLWGLPLGAGGGALAVLPAGAPAPAPTPGCGSCTQQAGAFAYGFPLSPFLSPLPAASAAACCALCAATPPCQLANYADGGCQLVEPPYALAPRPLGSSVLFPLNSTALPVPAVPRANGVEQHGPYYGGGGWPTVNGNGFPARAFGAGLPPALAPSAPSGPSQASQFTSEFGVGQIASFEIMAPTLSPTFWGMHGGAHAPDNCSGGFAHVCTGGNPLAQRNYGCDNAWATYFPDPASTTVALGDSGAEAFAAQLYLCQLATALKLKSLVEEHQSGNTFGLLTWQLGEMWSTYGWGSLEYSSGQGSVTGGRWKPSHYFLAKGYAPVTSACGVDGRCFVRNDNALAPFTGSLTLSLLRTRTGETASVLLAAYPIDLPIGASALHYLCAGNSSSSAARASNCTQTPGMDVQGVDGRAVPADSPAACCSACAADARCTSGVLGAGTCWLKYGEGVPTPKAGVVQVTPGGKPPPCAPLAALLVGAGCAASGSDCVLVSEVVGGGGGARNVQLLGVPGALAVAAGVEVAVAVAGVPDADGSTAVTVSASGGAAHYVTLFTLADGRFSDNCVLLLPGAPQVLRFFPFREGQGEVLAGTVRAEHLGLYLVPS